MGKKEREKGRRGEYLLRDFLNSHGFNTTRGMVFYHESDLKGLTGIHIEVKFVEALNVRKALAQAIDEAEKKKDGMPTVFWKKSRQPWVTVMLTEDWIKLYQMAIGGSNDKTEDTHR